MANNLHNKDLPTLLADVVLAQAVFLNFEIYSSNGMSKKRSIKPGDLENHRCSIYFQRMYLI